MKREFKKIDDVITGVVADIPTSKIKKIYFQRFYDSLRTFFLESDEEKFNAESEELDKIIDRMTRKQAMACNEESFNACNQICVDLRNWVRDEALESMFLHILYNRLMQTVMIELELYELTNDKSYFDLAMETLKEMNNSFNRVFCSDKIIGQIKNDVVPLADEPGLSSDTKRHVDFIIKFRDSCLEQKDLEDEEKTKKG